METRPVRHLSTHATALNARSSISEDYHLIKIAVFRDQIVTKPYDTITFDLDDFSAVASKSKMLGGGTHSAN